MFTGESGSRRDAIVNTSARKYDSRTPASSYTLTCIHQGYLLSKRKLGFEELPLESYGFSKVVLPGDFSEPSVVLRTSDFFVATLLLFRLDQNSRIDLITLYQETFLQRTPHLLLNTLSPSRVTHPSSAHWLPYNLVDLSFNPPSAEWPPQPHLP